MTVDGPMDHHPAATTCARIADVDIASLPLARIGEFLPAAVRADLVKKMEPGHPSILYRFARMQTDSALARVVATVVASPT
jgi:hypothetical protein